MSKVDSTNLIQITMIVDDIERVARNYCETYGLEMPEIWYHPGPESAAFEYRGKFCDVGKAKFCVFQFGPVALELAEVEDAPNTSWADFKRSTACCVHNIGLYVKDLQGALDAFAQKGCKAIHTGYFEDESYTIVEAEKEFGCRVNLKHAGEDNRKLIEEKRKEILGK